MQHQSVTRQVPHSGIWLTDVIFLWKKLLSERETGRLCLNPLNDRRPPKSEGVKMALTSVFTSQSISQLLDGPHCGRERGVSQRVTLSAVNTAQSVTSVSASHLLGTMSAVWHVAGQNLKLVHPRLQVQLHPDHWGIPLRERRAWGGVKGIKDRQLTLNKKRADDMRDDWQQVSSIPAGFSSLPPRFTSTAELTRIPTVPLSVP